MVLNKIKITRKGVGVAAVYTAAFSSLAFSLAFAYALLHPVDVIQDWSLTSTKSVYSPGQPITFSSRLNKVMNATGDSTRYIVCETGGAETRYKLAEEKKADRPMGKRDSKITVNIPAAVTNLPQSCHMNIHIDYSIYGFRSFVETVDSNTFKVVTAAEVPANQPENAPTAAATELKPSEARSTTAQPVAVQQAAQAPAQPATIETVPVVTTPADETVKPPMNHPETLTVLGIPLCVPITGICITTKG